MRLSALASSVIALGAGACVEPALEGIACGAGSGCSAGLSCDEGLCAKKPDPSDAGATADASGPQEDGGDPFTCNDDQALEPNDGIHQPTVTPVPDLAEDYPFVALAICPAGDVDVFRFGIAETPKDATVELAYHAAQGALEVHLLDDSGNSFAEAEPVGGDLDYLRVTATDLPVGVYYFQVQAIAASTINNYDVALTTGP